MKLHIPNEPQEVPVDVIKPEAIGWRFCTIDGWRVLTYWDGGDSVKIVAAMEIPE